jgi:hypothetical protein
MRSGQGIEIKMIYINTKTNIISIDRFLSVWAEWQFNPSIFSFKNNEAEMAIPKYLYDYIFLSHWDIDPLERSAKRPDWTPELEPFYGDCIKYTSSFGSFIFNLQQ